MTTRRLAICGFSLALALVGANAAQVAAQDPFGAAEPMPAAPRGAADDKETKPVGPPPTDDIVILSIRESNPTTPEQLLSAVKSLMDYGAFDEGRRYLAQLIASKPTAGQLAAAQRRFGTAFFLRLAAEKRLAPEAALVSETVMRSARLLYDSPERLQTMATQAVSADAGQRQDAISELQNAGVNAVAPLVAILADAKQPKQQAFARDALVALGEVAVPPLLGVLEATDEELRVQAIAVLTRLRTPRVIVHLLRPAHDPDEQPRVQAIAREALQRLNGKVPSKQDAEALLFKAASDYFAGVSPTPPDQDGLVTMWRWDSKNKVSAPHHYPANVNAILLPEIRGIDGLTKTIESVPASSIMAALLARDLHALFPNSVAYRQLFLATHLEAGQLMSGLGTALPRGPGTVHALVSQMEPAAIEDAMLWAIKNDHAPAAIAAAQVLGDLGDPTILLSRSGAPRGLAVALRHPNRRLRFAAVDAILKLNSTSPFPGSSFVPETLGYFAGTVGTRRALVADPRIDAARTFGGLLSAAGYDVDVAVTGKEAVKLALEQPDYEVVFLGDGVDHPDLNHAWQQLRKDPRTAHLLVAMLAREENLLALLEKAETDELARAMPFIYSREMLDFQLGQLYRRAGATFVPFAERQQQAVVALDHLARLANDGATAKHFDLLRQEEPVIRALNTPGLTVHAAPVLGGLATPGAQAALIDIASNPSFDLIDRQAAAKAFQAAVARRGVLLTTRAIGTQYDRYNASEGLDAETQQVFSSLLDVIEARSK